MRHVEREALLAAIDVGTSKVVALIGEVSRDGSLSVSYTHLTLPTNREV